jgi:outer membrane immunogenic protein
MMRQLSIAAIAASTIAFAQVASAADMPTKVPVAPAPAVYNWAGWYVGANAGGNWGRSSNQITFGSRTGTIPGAFYPDDQVAMLNSGVGQPVRADTSGFTGGIHGGYNWQFGSVVTGIEADFEYFRSAGSSVISGPYFANTATSSTSVSTDWLFTLRPRIGFAQNNWLFYATGGLAVTRIKATANYFEPANNARENTSFSDTKAGWTVGGGVETALPGNWLVGAEYLYVKFSDISTTALDGRSQVNQAIFDNPITHRVDLASNIVRARLSKKF